jgi:hypothetical protein
MVLYPSGPRKDGPNESPSISSTVGSILSSHHRQEKKATATTRHTSMLIEEYSVPDAELALGLTDTWWLPYITLQNLVRHGRWRAKQRRLLHFGGGAVRV